MFIRLLQLARRATPIAVCVWVAVSAPLWAHTATWPSKPVRLIVGFPGGSTPDTAARALAEGLSKVWGQAVVVEAKVGAGGNIAADFVSKANDDHTLGVVINGNLTTAKLLNPKLSYDPTKDLLPVSLIATAPLLLVSPADMPAGAAWVSAVRQPQLSRCASVASVRWAIWASR